MEEFEQIDTTNMSERQKTQRRRRRYPNVFFKKEITTLFSAIDDPKTIIASLLAFFCALRISEVCKLKWREIDLENCRLKVVDGKNHKDGFIPISPVCVPILKKWKLINPNQEYLLAPESNEYPYFSPKGLFARYKKALKKAGLYVPTEKNERGLQMHQYKFHTLRHSRCTHLLNNGVPIQKVQYFMRHDDISTTLVYTWITNPELQQMVVEADSPNQNLRQRSFHEPISQQSYSDPVEIAKRRFACGEISPKEFKRIMSVLQTPLSV